MSKSINKSTKYKQGSCDVIMKLLNRYTQYQQKVQNTKDYALIICNHTPHPRGRVGDSHGKERDFDQIFATSVRGKYGPGFALYMQKGP